MMIDGVCLKRIGHRLLVALFIMSWSSMVAHAVERVWTRSEILAIADAEMRGRGYDVDKMSVAFGLHGLEQQCGTGSGVSESGAYWTVYYAPLPVDGIMSMDADVCIFINRKTGELIVKPPAA